MLDGRTVGLRDEKLSSFLADSSCVCRAPWRLVTEVLYVFNHNTMLILPLQLARRLTHPSRVRLVIRIRSSYQTLNSSVSQIR